jgi:hypothetical protein
MCNRKIQIKEKYSHYEIRICHCKKWEDGCFEELLAMNQLQYIPSEKCFIFSKCHLDLVLYLLGHLEITYQIEEEYLYFDQDKAASSKPKDFDKGKWVSKTKNLVNVSKITTITKLSLVTIQLYLKLSKKSKVDATFMLMENLTGLYQTKRFISSYSNFKQIQLATTFKTHLIPFNFSS